MASARTVCTRGDFARTGAHPWPNYAYLSSCHNSISFGRRTTTESSPIIRLSSFTIRWAATDTALNSDLFSAMCNGVRFVLPARVVHFQRLPVVKKQAQRATVVARGGQHHSPHQLH